MSAPQQTPEFDLYRELEVDPMASPETIGAAWRALMKKYHPDRSGDDPATLERVKRINIAHDWLTEPALRARYDAERTYRQRLGTADRAPKSRRQREARPSSAPRRAASVGSRRDQTRHGGSALDEALHTVLGFGRFRGRTLAQVASLEPNYLRWMVREIRDKPELIARVRLVLQHAYASAGATPAAGAAAPPGMASTVGERNGDTTLREEAPGITGTPGGRAVVSAAWAIGSGYFVISTIDYALGREGGLGMLFWTLVALLSLIVALVFFVASAGTWWFRRKGRRPRR